MEIGYKLPVEREDIDQKRTRSIRPEPVNEKFAGSFFSADLQYACWRKTLSDPESRQDNAVCFGSSCLCQAQIAAGYLDIRGNEGHTFDELICPISNF